MVICGFCGKHIFSDHSAEQRADCLLGLSDYVRWQKIIVKSAIDSKPISYHYSHAHDDIKEQM